LQVTTFDLSPRSLDHLARARGRRLRGSPYVVQLPTHPQAKWKAGAGQVLGKSSAIRSQARRAAKPFEPCAAGLSDLKLRAVRIAAGLRRADHPGRSEHSSPANGPRRRLRPDHRHQHLVYYDVFEQSLALSNIESMLRDGGYLLSNNALLELAGQQMKSVNYLTVVYSDRLTMAITLLWYQCVGNRDCNRRKERLEAASQHRERSERRFVITHIFRLRTPSLVA